MRVGVEQPVGGSTRTFDDAVWRLPEALYALAPEATGLFDAARVIALQAHSPVLLELIRLRIAALIGDDAARLRRSAAARRAGLDEAKIGTLDRAHASPLYEPLERLCLEFCEQCVLDVGGPTEDYLDELGRHFPGERLRAFVTAIYLIEFAQRLDLVAGRLLRDVTGAAATTTAGLHRPGIPDGTAGVRALPSVMREYQAAVVRLRSLDPVLTELVRLRCARTHHCRICQTLRLADARAAGADDVLTAKIDYYETSDLGDRVICALRITDAMIGDPSGLDDATIERARATFTPPELAELCFDIAKWSTQKIHVALGTDAPDALPTDDTGVSYFAFDGDGRVAGYRATAD